MIHFSFQDLDHLNEVAYTRFLDQNLISFDSNAAMIVHYNLYTSSRQFLKNGGTLLEFVQQLDSDLYPWNTDVLAVLESYAPSNDSNPVCFYPYSKKTFISTFFSQIIPTLSNSLFDLMITSQRLRQIGSGQGKAFIIKPAPFTQMHFDSLPVQKTPQQISVELSSIVSSVQDHILNTDYLIEIIEEKDLEIEQLQEQIISLQNQLFSAYQTTWR